MKSILITVTLICLSAVAVRAQSGASVRSGPDANRFQWARSAWVGDDPEMRAERERIAHITENQARLTEIAEQAASKYHNSPSRLALFTWAFAQRYLTGTFHSGSNDEVNRLLAASRPPFSREFIRMRFLIATTYYNPSADLRDLGLRLIHSDERDQAVLCGMANATDRSTESGLLAAVAYAQKAVNIDPEKSAPYSVIGGCYFMRWLGPRVHSPADLRAAIHWYDEYLKRGGDKLQFGKRLLTMMPNWNQWLAEHSADTK
jgi:hypothetical protein